MRRFEPCVFELTKGAIPILVPIQRHAVLQIVCRPIDLRCWSPALESFAVVSCSQIQCRRSYQYSGISCLTIRPFLVPDARIAPCICRFLFSYCLLDPDPMRIQLVFNIVKVRDFSYLQFVEICFN